MVNEMYVKVLIIFIIIILTSFHCLVKSLFYGGHVKGWVKPVTYTPMLFYTLKPFTYHFICCAMTLPIWFQFLFLIYSESMLFFTILCGKLFKRCIRYFYAIIIILLTVRYWKERQKVDKGRRDDPPTFLSLCRVMIHDDYYWPDIR